MVFSSIYFVYFISFFFGLWHFLERHRYHLLLFASLAFYGAWNVRYIPLLVVCSFIAYLSSLACRSAMDRNRPRLALLSVSLGIGLDLGILFFFKYFTFVTSHLNAWSQGVGHPLFLPEPSLLLPVGISFYTFQSISHTVDVYRKEIPPARSFKDFLLYESLFPHLVAGPIQRARLLIPQVEKFAQGTLPVRRSERIRGADLILRGFAKKLLVADRLSHYVDFVFDSLPARSKEEIAFATLLFTVQIYCDFSGYTDIARGLAKWLGFEFSLNFHYPYFATSISEFWQRWHISLSSWFKDYTHKPLLQRLPRSTLSWLFTIFLVFLISGLWHGANFTFLAWGAYHGFLVVAHKLWLKRRWLTHWKVPAPLAIVLTFCAVCFGWFLFRVNHLAEIPTLWRNGNPEEWNGPTALQWQVLVAFFAIQGYEYFWLRKRWNLFLLPGPMRVAGVLAFLVLFWALSPSSYRPFIYFQF